MSAPHTVSLSSEWSVWRWAALRGAGFPASLVLRLAASDVAQAIDALLTTEDELAAERTALFAVLRRDAAAVPAEARGALKRAREHLAKGRVPAPNDAIGLTEASLSALRRASESVERQRAELSTAFDASVARTERALREVASDPRFREAVTWQNRGAVENGLDALLRSDPERGGRSHPRRRHEELVASYLHRYCTKNDTIGFFGPAGWAQLETTPETIAGTPGTQLLAKRDVYFEQWGIDAIAAALSTNERVREWVAPRRFGFVELTGTTARSPVNGKHELSPAEALVLRACGGARPARDLASELCATSPELLPDAASFRAALESLCTKGLIAWSLEFRTTWQPDRELRSRLERIGDESVREEALAMLRPLEEGRREIAAAAGDAERLGRAIADLDAAFTKLTGAAATRLSGATYAARSLVFEDSRRDFTLRLGPRLRSDLAPALDLVLASARWLSFEIGRAYTASLRELHATLAKTKGPRVPLTDLWLRSQRFFHGTNRPLDTVGRELRDRWARILAPTADARRVDYTSEALRPQVEAAFAAPRAGWDAARHHSPDVMIAASSIDAIARGEWLAVVGEVHVALNTLDVCALASQHPAPDDLREGIARDLPRPRVLIVPPKHSPLSSTVRLNKFSFGALDFDLETGFEASNAPRDRVVQLSSMYVEESNGELVAKTHDGRLEVPLLTVYAQPLGDAIANLLEFVPDADHAPRVTIDRLVVRRESWRFLPSTLAFAFATSELDAFVGARRWARDKGMPRFVFVRSPLEVKPFYVDFESPVSLRILAKIVRRAKEYVKGEQLVSMNEMLPRLDESWLPDASGALYTSELRIVVVDEKT